MHIQVKKFSDLNLNELYYILQLRNQVFVVEQNCVYQDIDDLDQKALHILGILNQEIVAYSRCFDKEIYFKKAAIGRVLVKENQRGFGYGHEILKASIFAIKEHFQTTSIHISAQLYLKKFYEQHGFSQTGSTYLEDGIPHIAMLRN